MYKWPEVITFTDEASRVVTSALESVRSPRICWTEAIFKSERPSVDQLMCF